MIGQFFLREIVEKKMKHYISAGLRLLGEEDIESYHAVEIGDLAISGIAVKLFGKQASQGTIDVATCMKIAHSDKHVQTLHDLEDLIALQTSDSIRRTVKIQRDALKGILKGVPHPHDKVLFVCMGSSADKLKMAFDYMGLPTHSAIFSRKSIPKPSNCTEIDSDAKCSEIQRAHLKKMFKELEKVFIRPLEAAFNASGADRIALLDFVDSGDTFNVILNMIATHSQDLYEKTFPVMILDPKEQRYSRSSVVTMLRIHPNTIEVPIDFDFFIFPKMYRCVPSLSQNAKAIELDPIDIARCNSSRVFYARHVLERART